MNSSIIKGRLTALRAHMAQAGIDACIVPTGDYHLSEYAADYFKTRKYITGFTGSAGTAVITAGEAALWTDSRYYLQAGMQLEGTGITLQKAGEPETPAIPQWIIEKLRAGGQSSDRPAVGFDGRMVSCSTCIEWQKPLDAAGIAMVADYDPFRDLWEDRPALPCSPAFELELAYTGQSRADKIAAVRKDLAKQKADALFLASLEDICWLLNLRGSDVHCNPVVLSFLLMDKEQVRLFAQREEFSAELTEALAQDGVILESYEDAGAALEQLAPDTTLWLSSGAVSAGLWNRVPDTVRILNRPNPTRIRKAVKNETEQECCRLAHLRDGVAVTKWICWLKQAVAAGNGADGSVAGKLTEISVGDRLHEFRAEQEHFMGDSFDAIVGYGPHGAIVHYFATPETDVSLEPHGLLLVDSGGHYLEGTTDITRTIVLGPVTDEEKTMFTAVLRGHIALEMAVFPRGLNGGNLDILAHAPLWAMHRDYGHGTGHGVGQFLSVHEGPQVMHWLCNGIRRTCPAFEPGMYITDEPGFYAEGKFGIRHENILLCTTDEKSEYGDFLRFEPLTLVPFDREAVDPAQMTDAEIAWLNGYHQTVYEKIAPHLNAEERAWLAEAAAPLIRA